MGRRCLSSKTGRVSGLVLSCSGSERVAMGYIGETKSMTRMTRLLGLWYRPHGHS